MSTVSVLMQVESYHTRLLAKPYYLRAIRGHSGRGREHLTR